MNFSQDWPTRHNKICREMIFHPKHFCGAAFSNTLPNIHASLHGYISHSAEMPHICGFKSVEDIFALQSLAFFEPGMALFSRVRIVVHARLYFMQ